MMRLPFILSLVLLASACATIRSDISVFHKLNPKVEGMKYTIVPNEEQVESLEYKSYEKIVRQQLNAKGLKEVPFGEAEVIVFFSYGIDGGKEAVSTYPIYGQTGVSSSSTYGTIQNYGSYGTYSGTTTYTPTYGVVGSGAIPYTKYTRYLILDMVDKSSSLSDERIKKVYEAKVISSGTSNQLPKIVPVMVKALFEDFPGKSGSTRKVYTEAD